MTLFCPTLYNKYVMKGSEPIYGENYRNEDLERKKKGIGKWLKLGRKQSKQIEVLDVVIRGKPRLSLYVDSDGLDLLQSKKNNYV